jgi:phage tail sheath protein FI
MAATDAASAPWFSPAGTRRGQYIGVVDIAINPSKSQRDALYKAGVNPIVSFPGQGIMLYGDKTHLSRPSAFDRINVRRLFLVIERAIAEAAENVMFEFNDEFTRAEFVNIVEPFLREIQGRRGITDFRLVCDSSNNTTEVIDRNEFVASCFIKPARSINYVTLNFVAVRSGVDFEEVVGTSGV